MLHEISHGYVAYRLGDPTAKSAGRLSLNPLKHVDPFGTIILPALLTLGNVFSGGGWPIFGYAKPVPINPRFFKNYRMGMLLTGLAGPATNLILAAVAGIAFRVLGGPAVLASGTGLGKQLLLTYLLFLTQVSLVLMFFNLIPIPPFDGSRVIPVFLSDRGMRAYAQVERYGMLIIVALLFLGQGLLSAYLSVTVDPLLRLFTGLG